MRDDASMGTIEKLPEWRLRRHGREAELELTGDWIACETGVRSSAEVRRIIDDIGAVRRSVCRYGIFPSVLAVVLSSASLIFRFTKDRSLQLWVAVVAGRAPYSRR